MGGKRKTRNAGVQSKDEIINEGNRRSPRLRSAASEDLGKNEPSIDQIESFPALPVTNVGMEEEKVEKIDSQSVGSECSSLEEEARSLIQTVDEIRKLSSSLKEKYLFLIQAVEEFIKVVLQHFEDIVHFRTQGTGEMRTQRFARLKEKVAFVTQGVHEIKTKGVHAFANSRGKEVLDPETEKKIGDLLEINYDRVKRYEFRMGQLDVYERIFECKEDAAVAEEITDEDDDEYASSPPTGNKIFPDCGNAYKAAPPEKMLSYKRRARRAAPLPNNL